MKYGQMSVPDGHRYLGNSADVDPAGAIPRLVEGFVFVAMLFAASFATGQAAAQTDNGFAATHQRVEAAITNIIQLVRPNEDGVATVWDGNKFVQCRHMVDDVLRCEAAGALMQPSLSHVLTSERVAALTNAGWRLDLSFGNYVQTLQATLPAGAIADKLIAALAAGYDADPAKLEVGTSWIERQACPPRAGPSQNLAGSINDSPKMAAVAVIGCAYLAPPADPPPLETLNALVARDGQRVVGEIGRLRVNAGRHVFVMFQAGIGYVQCAPQTEPLAMYCEAQSAEEWQALAAVLTPEHVTRLHELGFTNPGRAPNYWQVYDADKSSNETVARNVLAVLFEVYGYRGLPALEVLDERTAKSSAQ